jgi:hypothetical protein
MLAGTGLGLLAIVVIILASLNSGFSLIPPPTIVPSAAPTLAVVAAVNTDTMTPATPIAQALRSIAARAGPNAESPIVATLEASERLDIVGISEDGGWYQVLLPDGSLGWIAASAALISTSGDLQVVPIAQVPTETPRPTDTSTDLSTVTPSSTATITPDTLGTANAQATLDTLAAQNAQATAAQDALNFQVTMTQIVIDLTATAASWTTTPSPTLIPTNTPTPTYPPTATTTMTYTPQPTAIPVLRPSPSPQTGSEGISILPFQLAPPAPSGRIVFVDASADIAGNSQGDGTQSSPFHTIQDGINFASDGDAVHVAAGIYAENLVIRIKSLIIEGGYAPTTWERPHAPQATVIDGGRRAPVLWITDGARVAISGFAVQNGYNACDPLQRMSGGGFAINGDRTEVIIERTIIRDNVVEPPCGGGGIETNGSARVTVVNSLIAHNTANDGGGIVIWTDSQTLVINTTITANSPDGINIEEYRAFAFVLNSIICDHRGRDLHPAVEVVNSLVSVNPHFAGPDGDYHLQPDSPAIDAGMMVDGAPSIDLDGLPRPAGAGVDMGAYELQPLTGSPPVESVTENSGKLVSCDNDLCLVDNQGSSTPMGLSDRYPNPGSPSWSPDGSHFVFSACPMETYNNGDCWGSLIIASQDGSEVTPLVSDPTANNNYPAWSPDGEWIAYIPNGALVLVRPDGSELRTLLPLNSDYWAEGLAWSPDSQRIAWQGGDCRNCRGTDGHLEVDGIWVMNRDGTQMQELFRSPDIPLIPNRIAWSPDGNSIAVTTKLGANLLIDANCAILPGGCSQALPTPVEIIPEAWFPNFYPQWGRPPDGQE